MTSLTGFRKSFAALSVAFAGAAFLPGAFALDANQLGEARTVFLRAVQGEGAAVSPASERFKALLEKAPDNVVLRAYYGSCLALQGREAWMPWNKMKLTEDGLAQLDKALGQITPAHDAEVTDGVPASLEARLVAGSTFLGVPDMFRRFDAGKRVIQEAMSHAAFPTIPAAAQSRFFYQAAKIAQKQGKRTDEMAHLRSMLAADPASPDANAARKRLQEIGA